MKSGESRGGLPEWERLDAVVLAWPHDDTDWVDRLDAVRESFAQLAREIASHSSLIVLCRDRVDRENALSVLSRVAVDQLTSIKILEGLAFNDTWCRDMLPVCVRKNERWELLSFHFNGWGGKFPADLDNHLSTTLARRRLFREPLTESNFVLEGGAVEMDGRGTLLVTARCHLSQSRNPGFSRADLTALYRELFAVEQVCWVERGLLEGDDTDGHIDMLARFAPKGVLLYQSCDDPADSHYHELKQMRTELEKLRDVEGAPYTCVPLPMPKARYGSMGERLPASYANFLFCNDAILLPTYDDLESDSLAIDVVQKACPDFEIVPVDCRLFIEQHGSLHCLTMQFPQGTIAPEFLQ